MKELIQLFAQIALLRRGPQDLPASALLLGMTIVGFAAINFLIGAVLPPSDDWPQRVAVDVVFTVGWYFLLLRLAGRSERTLQTTTAVFGFQAVLAPLLVVALWLLQRFKQDTTWQLPVALIWLTLFVWVVAANSHVVKSALEWSSSASVFMVLLESFVGQLLQLALFSTPPH